MPLSEKWLTEIQNVDAIPLQEANIEYKNLIAVLATEEMFISQINRKKRKSDLQVISRFFYSHASQLTHSIYELCKVGMGNAAMVLCRAQFESLVDYYYLWLCKEIHGSFDERKAWAAYGLFSRDDIYSVWGKFKDHRVKSGHPAPEDHFKPETVAIYKSNKEKFKKTFNRDYWALKSGLLQRTRAIDDTNIVRGYLFEEQYCFLYKWTSELVHGLSASSMSYTTTNENHITFSVGGNSKNVKATLIMATKHMIMTMELIIHIFHLDINIDDCLKMAGFQPPVE